MRHRRQDCIIGGKHGSQTLIIPIYGPTTSAGGSPGSTHVNISGTTVCLQVGIPLPVGARILGCRASITDNATGPTKLEMLLVKSGTGSGAAVTIATSAASAGNGSDQTLSITGQTEIVATGKEYWCWIHFQTGSASSFIHNVEVDFDLP